jgi:hypothetical protein
MVNEVPGWCTNESMTEEALLMKCMNSIMGYFPKNVVSCAVKFVKIASKCHIPE